MKTYLEPKEIRLLEDKAANLRDRLLIRLLFHLGCRITEALRLTVWDIDFSQGTVTIQHLKTRIKLSCTECGQRLGRSHTFCPMCGGKEGNPDVVFVIDDTVFVLELTTFRGIRAQWSSAEASSVPDHIVKFKKLNPGKRIIGIFSAPSIHPQLKQNLTLNAKREKVGMIFRPCIEFAEFLSTTNREELKSTFIKESENQLGS